MKQVTKVELKKILAIFLSFCVVIAALPIHLFAAEAYNEVFVDNLFTPLSEGWGITAFASIRDGINAVADGGTVHVASGTYTEIGEIEVTRPMTILGQNYWDDSTYVEQTFISVKPQAGATHCDTIIWVHNCQNVYISGLTLDRDMVENPETPEVQTPTSQTGIVFTGQCDFNGSKISNCKVIGKRVVPDDNCFSALEVIQVDDVIFENNIVEGVVNADEFAAEVFYDGGIGTIGGCEDIIIRGNIIDGLGTGSTPKGGGGISCLAAGSVIIDGNVTKGCRYGIYENQVNLTITGNEIIDNDIGVQCGAWTMELHHNTIYNNTYNISCGYTEKQKVDATQNNWGLYDESAIKATCDGNVSVFPWATDAERNEDGNFKYLSVFTYTFADEKATVVSYLGTNAKVYIPAIVEVSGRSYPVTAIGDGVFQNKTELQEIIIPDGVIGIGDSAFKGSKLTGITIPDSVTSIGSHAFEDCTDLVDLSLSPNVSVLKECVFKNTSIKRITIPDGVTSIENAAFAFCDELESVSFSDNVTEIGDCAFNTTAIKKLVLPKNLTTIGTQAFSDNDVLTCVELPASVTSMGIWAFTDNNNMTDAYLYGDAPFIDRSKWPTHDPIPFGENVTVHYLYGKVGYGYNDDGDLDHDPLKWYGSPTAKFVPVTFDLNGAGGAVPAKQLLNVGETVKKPDSPNRSGYSFAGWYTTDGPWDFNTAQVTDTMGPLVLCAVWQYINNSDGSSGSTPAGAQIEIDGQVHNCGSVATSYENGRTITTVIVDDAKLEDILKKKGPNTTVVIPVTTGSDVAAGTLTGRMIKKMEEKGDLLEIRTSLASYTLSASEFNIDAVSKQFGTSVEISDINVRVEIAEPSADTIELVERTAGTGNFSIMVPAIDFTINCTYGVKTVALSSFNAYVERTIAIPEGVDHNNITTAIIVERDGSTRHVPTQITIINGKYYAVINSLTNSTYTVIWHPFEFKDVTATHWAKETINNMGSRMVIHGVDGENYFPDRDITRAEFVAILVSALGIAKGTSESSFSDIQSADWYCGFIKTAAEYQFIMGYDATTFGPNDKITREQAMVILARAMKITGLDPKLIESEISTLLSSYADAATASDYAKSSIAACLKTGIISGKNGSKLALKDYVTRAEAVVMIERLLKNSSLI